MSEKNKTFEERLIRLEEIVKTVEGKTLPLEEAMKLYQEGKDLANELAEELRQAKLKLEENGKPAEEEIADI